MRGRIVSDADDLIIEPIEEAVALHGDLLKDLYRFMASTSFSYRSHARSVATFSRVPSGNVIPLTFHSCAAQFFRDYI